MSGGNETFQPDDEAERRYIERVVDDTTEGLRVNERQVEPFDSWLPVVKSGRQHLTSAIKKHERLVAPLWITSAWPAFSLGSITYRVTLR